MKDLNKGEFIKAIAEKAGSTIKGASDFYAAFEAVVLETLKAGGKIALTGFGTFEARKRAARTAINPATKAKVKVAATVVPALKFGKSFKEAVAKKK